MHHNIAAKFVALAAVAVSLVSGAGAEEVKMLFLGNSITRHPPYADIGWTHDWGMAATEEAKDYVHVLAASYAENYGVTPVLRVRNIATFEQNWSSYDLDVDADIADDIAFAPDVVVIAIGENVPDISSAVAAFQAKFKALCEKFSGLVAGDKFLIRAPFWNNPTMDAVQRAVATELGVLYVDSSLCDSYENEAHDQGWAHSGIAAHPGDSGMAAIAAQMLAAFQAGLEPAVEDEDDDWTEPANVSTVGEYATVSGTGEAVDSAPAKGGNAIRVLSNGEYVHYFTGSGTFRAPLSCDIEIQYLAVGGGGGGGGLMGGGGGAGAVVAGAYTVPAGGAVDIVVGAGGAGGNGDTGGAGGNGGATTMHFSGAAGLNLAAMGGGAGAAWSGPNLDDGYGRDGASGGGGGGAGPCGTHLPGRGLQGHSGGASYGPVGSDQDCFIPGGGGGAGTPGGAAVFDVDAQTGAAGSGGDGVGCSITGASAIYGAGGAGGWCEEYRGISFTAGAAGSLGANGGAAATPATANTGAGGGGGGWPANKYGGAGASGVVIIRYAVPAGYDPSLENQSKAYGDYVAVEYIASSGLEDIDTGIACDGNLATSVEITPLAAANNAQNAVFGSAWTGSGYFMMFAVDGYSGYAQCIRFNTGNAYSDAFEGTEWNFGERVSIAADKNGYTINGHRHDIQGGGDESANVKLFWVGNDYGLSHSQYGGVFRLHGCTMTNLVTGEIYRDFIPVRRVSDGAVGLYDTVSGRFFGNASGAGAFTAGEDLEFDRSAPVSADFATLTGTGPASADFDVAVAAIGEGATGADIYADCLRNGTVATTVKVAAVNRAGLVSFTLSPLAPASQYEVAFRVVNNLGATASTRTIAFSTAAETWAYSADYLQLDYIEGTGSQYIWTNVGYSDDLVTEAEVTIDANPAHPTCAIFGSSWCADGYFMMFETDGGVGRIVFNACGTALKVEPGEVWNYGERTTLVGRRNSFSVNGVEYNNVGGGAGNRASWVHLFWVGENFYNIDINTYAGTFKLHHCKMENGSGVLRDYWPAQRLSDGAVGLLDTENEVFYERVGSGAFAAGGAVETLEIETCEYDGSALEVTLTRRLAEEADVYAVWGAQYGYRDAESWQHEAAAGTVSSSGAVTFRLEGADLAGANYLRFYTSRGEWTSTVFLPDYAPPAPEGLKIMVH